MATPARPGRLTRISQSRLRCQLQQYAARSSALCFRPHAPVRRHPGSSRPALRQWIRWRVDRKWSRLQPCRMQRRRMTHLRGYRRSLPAPPIRECHRRASKRGHRRGRSSTPGTAEHSVASPGVDPVPQKSARNPLTIDCRCVRSCENPPCFNRSLSHRTAADLRTRAKRVRPLAEPTERRTALPETCHGALQDRDQRHSVEFSRTAQ